MKSFNENRERYSSHKTFYTVNFGRSSFLATSVLKRSSHVSEHNYNTNTNMGPNTRKISKNVINSLRKFLKRLLCIKDLSYIEEPKSWVN